MFVFGHRMVLPRTSGRLVDSIAHAVGQRQGMVLA